MFRPQIYLDFAVLGRYVIIGKTEDATNFDIEILRIIENFEIGFSPAAIGRYVVFLKTQRSLSPTDPMPFTMTFLEIDIGFDDVQII